MLAETNIKNLTEVLKLLKIITNKNDGEVQLSEDKRLLYYIHADDYENQPIEEWYGHLTVGDKKIVFTKVKSWDMTWDETPFLGWLYEELKKKFNQPSQMDIKELTINGKVYRLVE